MANRTRYFHISNGLRGCYMPDNASVVKVTTRRALKELIAYDANDLREVYSVGGSKKAVAGIAADAWREAWKPNPSVYPLCLPFGRSNNDMPYGLFISVATKDEYEAYLEELGE